MSRPPEHDQICELLEKAEVADGANKVALLRHAVRLVDQLQDVEGGMQLRDALIGAACDAGFYEDELLSFNWMLAQLDRDPQRFAPLRDHILWYYKWILEHLHEFPQVSKAQIEQTFRDMERRYTQAGHGLRALYRLLCCTAVHTGELERAAELERKWRSAGRDKQTDCAACEVGNHVEYFVDAGRDADALAEAKPLFGRKMKCREVPNNTFSRLLLPLLSAGHVKEAAACQREVVKFICDSRQFIAYQADHLIFYSLTGQATKAVKLLEARLPWAMETRNGRARFRFLLGSRLVLARLHAEGRASVRLRVPETLTAYRAGDEYPTAELADWFLGTARDLGAQFDRRNGNDHYSNRLIARNEALVVQPTIALPSDGKSSRDAA